MEKVKKSETPRLKPQSKSELKLVADFKKSPYSKRQPKTTAPYTEIFLIRHCHPNYDLQKKLGDRLMPLSRTGLKQRKFLTAKLLEMDIDRVYTSSILRAQETAKNYLKKVGKEAIVDDGLDEVHWAHWRNVKFFNMSEDNRKKRFKDHKYFDKELDEMQADVRRVFARIYRENKNKSIAVVCHGNLIRSLLSGILNADIIGFLSMEIFQSSISEIIVDKDGYIKIIYINDTNHLPNPPRREFFKNPAE